MKPKNGKLYQIVKSDADAKFLAKTSAYKSAWIVREYKKRGGLFLDEKDESKGLIKWFKEKWIDLNKNDLKNNNNQCGRKKATLSGVYPLCRPTVKVNEKTPLLNSNIDKQKLSSIKKEKQKQKNKGKINF